MLGKGKFPWMIWKYHAPSPVMWRRMRQRRSQDFNPYQYHHTKTQTVGKKVLKPSPLHTDKAHTMCYAIKY